MKIKYNHENNSYEWNYSSKKMKLKQFNPIV